MKQKLVLAAILALAIVVQAKNFKLAYEEYPPYEYKQDGKLVGVDIEILEEAAKIAGATLEFKEYPWARATKMAEDGEVDAIFSMSKTAEREKVFYFPAINLASETNVIFANDSYKGDVKSLVDLKGKTIGVIQDYSYGTDFDNFKDCKKELNSNQDALVKKLQANRFQLAINNELVGNYMAKSIGATNIRVLSYVVNTDPLYLGISKKAPNGKEFYDKISAALSSMEKSGRLKAIRDKYLK